MTHRLTPSLPHFLTSSPIFTNLHQHNTPTPHEMHTKCIRNAHHQRCSRCSRCVPYSSIHETFFTHFPGFRRSGMLRLSPLGSPTMPLHTSASPSSGIKGSLSYQDEPPDTLVHDGKHHVPPSRAPSNDISLRPHGQPQERHHPSLPVPRPHHL